MTCGFQFELRLALTDNFAAVQYRLVVTFKTFYLSWTMVGFEPRVGVLAQHFVSFFFSAALRQLALGHSAGAGRRRNRDNRGKTYGA